MNPALLLSVINKIFTVIKLVRSIQDLAVDNATSVITIDDLTVVVRGENARFFSTIAFADIQTIHRRFREVWLPSILDFGRPGQSLTPPDLNNPSGRLYHVFRDLKDAIKKLDYNLNRLYQVFKTYMNALEVDELTTGFFAIIHGYGLLFHMHAVYAELHRIQISAPTLSDPDLRQDTRLILQYLWDAADAIGWFAHNPAAIRTKRLPLISAVGSRLVPLPHGNSFLVYYYRDQYNALSSTEPSRQLTVAQPPKSAESRKESVIVKARAQRVAGVENAIQRVVYNTYRQVWLMYNQLNTDMRARGREQGITAGSGGFPGGRRPLPSLPILRPPVPRPRVMSAGEEIVCEGDSEEVGDLDDSDAAAIPETFFDLSQADDDDNSDPFAITLTTADSVESFEEDQLDLDELVPIEELLAVSSPDTVTGGAQIVRVY